MILYHIISYLMIKYTLLRLKSIFNRSITYETLFYIV